MKEENKQIIKTLGLTKDIKTLDDLKTEIKIKEGVDSWYIFTVQRDGLFHVEYMDKGVFKMLKNKVDEEDAIISLCPLFIKK